MAKASFAKNIEFLKFLNLARTNDVVRRKLKRRDFSVIDDYPELSREERAALKSLDWKRIKFNFKEKDIEKYGPTGKGRPKVHLWAYYKMDNEHIMEGVAKQMPPVYKRSKR